MAVIILNDSPKNKIMQEFLKVHGKLFDLNPPYKFQNLPIITDWRGTQNATFIHLNLIPYLYETMVLVVSQSNRSYKAENYIAVT